MGGFREPGGFFDFFSEVPVFFRLIIVAIFLVVISVFACFLMKLLLMFWQEFLIWRQDVYLKGMGEIERLN
ncbi:hypothetical protein JI735_28500 [Paenibacillus sonchi]|uniref:Uncharacterized protein n=1 Tax=Paenibacillus sonchi TaxID=373687 RepID=A0A974SBG7_9BACL|nr:hypothetical protein [Paenibacillus sonchi]MCE3201611.1 hypothetical protein [Paenibacillus sonchi]QQZ60403.1 hypothetical protein JI735_28500 [Paenibacillus sonchi]